jgi:hypothetical protein
MHLAFTGACDKIGRFIRREIDVVHLFCARADETLPVSCELVPDDEVVSCNHPA